MMLIDANLLLYAYDESSPNHAVAKPWLEKQFSGRDLVALSWQCITAFIRISTNPRAFASPFSVREAAEIVNEWFVTDALTILAPAERHWAIYRDLLETGQASGPLAMDAHLAALAIEHGAVLCTTDKDFSRFGGLRTHNPISGM